MNCKTRRKNIFQPPQQANHIFWLFSLLWLIYAWQPVENFSQQKSQAPAVWVSETGDQWIIKGPKAEVSIFKKNLQMKIKTTAAEWEMMPPDSNDFVIAADSLRFHLGCKDAQRVEFSNYSNGFATGIKIELSQFQHDSLTFDLVVQLFITLERPEDELVIAIVPIENKHVLKTCRLPKGFSANWFDFTVVPFMQGMLLPKNWPKDVWLYDTFSYGRGLYMPWWGHQQGESAVIVILVTPTDAGCDFSHPANGPTYLAPKWLHSLGSFNYPRQIRMCFFDKANYVDLAKRYRKYIQETGHFVSLKEKIARTPQLEKLIGSPVLHTSILYHTMKESSYYDKEHPENNHQLTTFAQRLADLKQLRRKGIKKLYVHLDGWGYRGYDNLHPDYLPPCPEAGGWDGMRQLVDGCQKMGYVIALHDQYRDYYLDAVSFDLRHTKILENGQRYFEQTWAGGRQSILCPSLAPGFVRQNHQLLIDHDINVNGSYLDVFAVVPPEECYNSEHPVTRTQCLQFRAHCFTIIKQLEGIVSSEEPADWAIPYLDLVHHGPYALAPNPGAGPAMGIPIPLFNLVYHDAILLPWSISTAKGGWGIPDTDSGFLHGLLNAGMPYLSITPDKNEIKKVKQLSILHQRVGKLEMIDHELLDNLFRKQRATFADGTTVTVDFDKNNFLIEPR